MNSTNVFQAMLGKTIKHVLLARPGKLTERIQLFLVFTDDTACELWGTDLRWASDLDYDGAEAALNYLESRAGVEVTVISKPQAGRGE